MTAHREPSTTLKLGYVLRMYPRFSQTFVVNEILELENQGVDLSIASLKKPTDGRFHEAISRVRAKADYLPELFVESPGRILKTHWAECRKQPRNYARALGTTIRRSGVGVSDFLQAAMLIRWMTKRGLSHIHVHFGTHEASVAYLAYLLTGVSYSLTLHAFDIFRDNVDHALLARKINGSRFAVTVSAYNREYLTRLPGVDPDKVRVNYNGVDLSLFKSNGTQREPFSILGVGRLIEKKGFVHLIRAVRRLRDQSIPATCTIIGEGPQKTLLKDEIKRLKLRKVVTLAGPLSQEQVRERLTSSSCFALPCVRASDGNIDALPTVLLEAMACRCPCVSTTLSGVPEIIEQGRSGMLVPPADDAALAYALGRILKTPALQAEISTSGRLRAEEIFDIHRNVARMKSWFEDVAASPCGSPTKKINAKERLSTGEAAELKNVVSQSP